MPRPALRSRRHKRKAVRTPGGRTVLHILAKKYDVPKCAICKRPLHGFGKMRPKDARKGHRPPSRPYGGYLCPSCLKKLLIHEIRLSYSIH